MTKNYRKKKCLHKTALSTIVDNALVWEVSFFKRKNGKVPIMEWIGQLDRSLEQSVHLRIERVLQGNLGHFKNLPGGISELKFKSGLRIYYALINKCTLLLLLGGNKASQNKDIKKAREYLKEYRDFI